jgi:hypothetical protein
MENPHAKRRIGPIEGAGEMYASGRGRAFAGDDAAEHIPKRGNRKVSHGVLRILNGRHQMMETAVLLYGHVPGGQNLACR